MIDRHDIEAIKQKTKPDGNKPSVMIRFVLILSLISGCATVPNRHERPEDSTDRTVALGAYAFGGLVGFGG